MNVTLTPHAHLGSLSTLAERRYLSAQKTIAATLESAAEQLAVHSSFLLYYNRQQALLEVQAAYNGSAEHTIDTGMSVPLPMSAITDTPLLAPLVIEDVTAASVAAPFLSQPIFAHIGCFISVPVKLADGTIYGFLCGVDSAARQFATTQLDVLIILARHLVAEIEHDHEIGVRRTVESQLEQSLARLRVMQREMERMQKLKRDFVTIVSHEFRTALTGIQGFSEIVRDEECTADEVKEFAADINADARRLNRLITDMLDLERSETGKLAPAFGLVNLNTLLCAIVTRFGPLAPHHDIQMQLDPDLATVPGDSNRLEQAFTHLLSNAVKFSPGGAINVSTRRDGEHAHVSITDNGMGIPADDLEHIFERFTRAESRPSRYIQGTGLGLSIVRDTITLHGGKVWAESMLGHGATFHVDIPLFGAN